MSDPFQNNPDLVACARLVEQGDPERFMAAMAAPVAARAVLFPIYAFNVEVSRAPWVTKEPMIAQMRLQWWADALEEIRAGGMVRRHEVVTPLALAIGPEGAARLGDLVEARRLDIEKAPFEDEAALLSYLERTAGALAHAAAGALGAGQPDAGLLAWGRASGLVRYLRAVPELEARAKLPLPDGRAEAVARLASGELQALRTAGGLGALRRRLGKAPAAAALEFWQAAPLLRQIASDPAAVAEGRVSLSEFGRRWRLLWAAR
ncbi:squalene/phytoene synthase family protein [Tropicibacter oceani]|uniref:Squalene/phytoene synthase family protein n=1 Tax=Tropicibacter oceani TaxID=3058420 RepID=A0ABY8QGB8_9RHOB|nr:squalene/phytoene synthase family protein [Tropicibacter oceani]WGW03227.1 squalene/phytoene synthase family protein [Tropicibacter oceani]